VESGRFRWIGGGRHLTSTTHVDNAVHGLVLAAETAIGVDPVGTVDMVLRMIRAFDRIGLGALSDPELQPAGANGHGTLSQAVASGSPA
jgi:hypothetical protein